MSKTLRGAEVLEGRRDLLAWLTLAPFVTRSAGAAPIPTQLSQTAAAPIIVFDVNETILDFNVLAPVFVRIFDDPTMLRVWFNQVILYSEALTLSDQYVDSGTVGVAVLEMLATIKKRRINSSDLGELKRLSGAMPT